jgi:hypothetical protein
MMENKIIIQKFSSIDSCQMLNLQRKKQQFTDVTLNVNRGSLLAHKNVLAANSNYFCEVLTKLSQCPHPIIVLNELSLQIMSDLLECIYIGQVMIQQKDLKEFVRAAESLKIQLVLPPLATSEPSHVRLQNSGSTSSFALTAAGMQNLTNTGSHLALLAAVSKAGQAGFNGFARDALVKKPRLPCEICGQLLADPSSMKQKEQY